MAQNDVNIKVRVDASQAEQQTINVRKRMKELMDQMTQLQLQGKANTAEYAAAAKELGNLKDAISDTAAQARIMSDDFFQQQAAMEGLAVGVNIFSGLAQAAALCGVENEDLQKTLVKLQAAQNLANTAMNIAKALNKDTALMTALRTARTNALTAAETKNTAATATATTATAGFTAAEGAATAASGALTVGIKAVGTAIKSIPVIGWILAAIAALTTLITLIASANKEESEGVQLQKMKEASLREQQLYLIEATKSVEQQSIKLKYNAARLKECKENSDEWSYYAEQVSKELGISKVWLEKNKDRVDDLVDAWTKLKTAQATADAAAQKIAENNIEKEEVLLKLKKIQNMDYDDRIDKIKELGYFTSQEVNEINKAMHDANYIYKEGNKTFTTTDAILRQMAKHAQERLDAENKTYENIINNQQDIITNNNEIVNGVKEESDALDDELKTQEKYRKSLKETSKETDNTADRIKKLNEEIDKLSETEDEVSKITNKYNGLISEAVELFGAESEQVKALTDAERKELEAFNKKTKALEQQKNLQDEVYKAETKTLNTSLSAQEELAAKIKLINAQRTLELSNTELTEAQRANIIAKYDKQIYDAKKDYNDKALEDAKAKAEEELKINQMKYQTIIDTFNMVSDLTDSLMESELQKVEGNAKNEQQVRKKYASLQFALQIGSIATSTAKAIMETWAAYGEIPFVGPALAGAQTAVILGLAAAQTVQANTARRKALSGKAARGAFVKGRSHAEGGELYELEGGEAVLNKQAMSVPAFRALASAMNESTGGVAFDNILSSSSNSKSLITASVSDDTIQKIVSSTISGIAAIPVVVTENDITTAQRNVSVINARSTF